MEHGNTDWSRSVAGVVVRDGKVLLVRHSYGAGKGMLIVPGGYVNRGENPEDAVRRELLEETGVEISAGPVLGIRFNQKDWYVAFLADYLSGEARSDNDENSEALWLDCTEALSREDVPGLTKSLIESALKARENGGGLEAAPYESKNGGTLYRV
ncbi:NUDIX domain-containing protein [uncultured Neglectibacter sp.]|uniref:NUDIX domain-containing protein n=1 Tax=uncultured Neglectibacter sp. TaxID=1924108 RepID=UPI0034E047B1